MLSAVLLVVGQTLPAPDSTHTRDSTHFSANIRFVSAAGNATSSTFSLGDTYDKFLGPWAFGQEFQMIYGTDGTSTLANFYLFNLSAKYALNKRTQVMGYGGWQRNTPAGLNQRFEEGIGVTYVAMDKPRDKINVEGGPTLVQESRPDGDRHFTAARLAADYNHTFREKTTFEQKFEYMPDLGVFANYQFNSHTALAVPVSGIVGVALSYDVRYTNQPPPGFKKADRFLTAGLQLTR